MAYFILPEGWDRPTTNADIIRHMTDEELANILTTINNSKEHPHGDWLDWLKQEATDGE